MPDPDLSEVYKMIDDAFDRDDLATLLWIQWDVYAEGEERDNEEEING